MAEEIKNIKIKPAESLVKNTKDSLVAYKPSKAKRRILKQKLKTYHFDHQTPKTPPILPVEVNEQKVENAEKQVEKQRSRKKRWLNFLFMAINIAIVAGLLIYQFNTDDAPVSLGELFTFKINWWFMLAALGVFFAIMLFDTLRIDNLVKYSTKRRRFYLSYKTNALGRFYDNITPMYTGGQPFQIYYMVKRGISGGTASGIPLAKFIIHQIIFSLLCVVLVIAQNAFIVTLNPYVLVACYTGLGLMVALAGGVLFLSVSKKVGPAITKGVLKLLSKMRIVKNYEARYEKVMGVVKEYTATVRFFFSNPKVLIPNVIYTLVLLVLTYSLPFVVYCIFEPFNINMWFTFFTIAIVCDLSAAVSPLPGGSGLAEVSFAALAAPHFGPGVIVWAMLIWRFFAYYLVLLHGLGVILYDYIAGNKKIAPLLQRFKREDEAKENRRLLRLKKRKEEELNISRSIIKLPRFKKTKNGIRRSDDDIEAV